MIEFLLRDKGTLDDGLGKESKLDSAGDDGTHAVDSVDINKWKTDVRRFMEGVCIPGAYIEERPFALILHYRSIDKLKINEAILAKLILIYDLQCVRGEKFIEIRPNKIGKGHAVSKWLTKSPRWEFILAIGDDLSDEDTFEVVNASDSAAYTVKVGGFRGGYVTAARFALLDVEKVRDLIDTLIRNSV